MKLSLFVGLLLLCVAFAAQWEHYIVVFHKNIPAATRNAHILRHKVTANYSIGEDFNGFAAHLTEEEVQSELASGDIDFIEKDQVMHVNQACKVQTNAVWGLNRISERTVTLTGDYRYDNDGAGVVAYIIDTGILVTHTEFVGRATFGANFVGDGRNTDCNGHGTHVAGTVGGTTYGVAKKVTLVAVKVLGCTGSGTNAGVISGINYAANDRKGRPGVANMSLGGGKSAATNAAVAAAVKSGLLMAVAAGNENQDACNVSPASEPTALTVGATEVNDDNQVQEDERSSYSNYGTCVKIMAPGTLIKSAWYTSNTATNTISGTSMATPHVCGAAALILGESPSLTPTEVLEQLKSNATPGEIDMACTTTACRNTPNLMLFSAC